jgi:hypothetical protein
MKLKLYKNDKIDIPTIQVEFVKSAFKPAYTNMCELADKAASSNKSSMMNWILTFLLILTKPKCEQLSSITNS